MGSGPMAMLENSSHGDSVRCAEGWGSSKTDDARELQHIIKVGLIHGGAKLSK